MRRLTPGAVAPGKPPRGRVKTCYAHWEEARTEAPTRQQKQTPRRRDPRPRIDSRQGRQSHQAQQHSHRPAGTERSRPRWTPGSGRPGNNWTPGPQLTPGRRSGSARPATAPRPHTDRPAEDRPRRPDAITLAPRTSPGAAHADHTTYIPISTDGLPGRQPAAHAGPQNRQTVQQLSRK